jgi:hypothetical protein
MKNHFIQKVITFFVLLSVSNVYSQSLLSERIWKLPKRKKSIYIDKGIFHHSSKTTSNSLVKIRNSFLKNRKYERIVFDFAKGGIPRLYGNINRKNKKLYLDLFDTSLSSTIKTLKNTKFISSLDFYNIDKGSLSIELNLKEDVNFDIFILENSANSRLVIDIKKK